MNVTVFGCTKAIETGVRCNAIFSLQKCILKKGQQSSPPVKDTASNAASGQGETILQLL